MQTDLRTHDGERVQPFTASEFEVYLRKYHACYFRPVAVMDGDNEQSRLFATAMLAFNTETEQTDG